MRIKRAMQQSMAVAGLAVGMIALGVPAANAAFQASPTFGGGYDIDVNAGATTSGQVNSVAVGHPDSFTIGSETTDPYTFTGTVSFTAPEHTIFADASVRMTTSDGVSVSPSTTLSDCVLSAGDTVVTCSAREYVIPGATLESTSQPAVYWYTPRVTAAVDAPTGSFPTTGTLTVSDPYLQSGTTTSTVNITAAAPTPMVDAGVATTVGIAGLLAAGAVMVVRRRRAMTASS